MKKTINDIEKYFEKSSIDSNELRSIYFLGIGGIGMSAIARYFNSRGIKVSGYDKTETLLTKQLQAEGISVHYEDSIAMVDEEADFIVYTPAIPSDHQEYKFLIENGYVLLKRSEVLALITKSSFNICVAGTHGKTTTSSMIAHILRHSGYGCNAFLGGIASNYNTNFWSDTNNVCVIEADEYDRSFLKLNPDIAIITAMDPDHLDIYETKKNFSDAFVSFSEKVKNGGLLICKEGLDRLKDFVCSEKVTYDLNKATADAYAKNLTSINGSYQFDVKIAGVEIEKVELNMGGLHNIENAIAAIFVAKKLGISDVKIKEAIATFQGVKRRFEYVIKSDQMVMIDDYAHHPSELEALIKGVRGLFPGKKCSLVFQPHLYSRTRDFVEGFAYALSLADEVFLLPIYPAREKPIKGITSELIAEKMGMNKVVLVSKEELLEVLKNKKNTEVLIMAGAGDIDSLVMPIKNSILI